jgi:hypothetical protein
MLRFRQLPQGATVVIIRRTLQAEPDVRGNDVYVESRIEVRGCSVQSGATSEIVQGTELVSSDVVVYMPSGTDLYPVDALEIDGERYEIQGQPGSNQSPFTGSIGPVEVRANRQTGVTV